MYIVAYRLINLLNDSEYDSTEAHIAESLLGIIKEIEHMPIGCGQMPHIKVHVVQVCKKTGV